MVPIGHVPIASGMVAGHLLSTEYAVRDFLRFSVCNIMCCPISYGLVLFADAPNELDEILWL
jgi:hypothetical protein